MKPTWFSGQLKLVFAAGRWHEVVQATWLLGVYALPCIKKSYFLKNKLGFSPVEFDSGDFLLYNQVVGINKEMFFFRHNNITKPFCRDLFGVLLHQRGKESEKRVI